jgi:formylglycine-generating enzyme required for sulfatase activity
LSKLIDLSDDNPPVCGRGWWYADGVYTIVDWANVTVTGDNGKSGRRIVVKRGAKKVNLTFDNVTLNSVSPPIHTNFPGVYNENSKVIPLNFVSPVTLKLIGKNSITTSTKSGVTQGRNRTFVNTGIAIACGDLTIIGSGSLTILGSIACGSWRVGGSGHHSALRFGNITIFDGKVDIICGSIIGGGKSFPGGNFTMNGGELTFSTRDEKEFSTMRLNANAITVNGGILSALTHSLSGEPIRGETVTINGGIVRAEDASWTHNFCPPLRPAIKALGSKDSSTHEIQVEARVTINGGTVTAIVPSTSCAPAIGNEDALSHQEEVMPLGKIYMNGGVLFASQLTGKQHGEYFPAGTCLEDVKRGILFEGRSGTFYGENVDILADTTIPENHTVRMPAGAGVTVMQGVNFVPNGKIKSNAIRNATVPPPPVPQFTPDIFEYVDERADYKIIDGFEMMRVRAGTFMMGATADQGWEVEVNEKPVHQVTLTKDYYMCLFPVTQKQWTEIFDFNPAHLQRNDFPLERQIEWSAVLGSQPSRFAENGFYPIECVNHIKVREFLTALNKKTGKNFRLPTEAEWEYAARGGLLSQSFMYSGSNNLSDVALREGLGTVVSPTATKDCNELGLYDMSGLVGEWVNDYYGEYTEPPKTDPVGASAPPRDPNPRRRYEPEYIIRGGGSMSLLTSGRVAWRKERKENRKDNDVGFRLVLTAED